jgi:hypothetical protein
MTISQQRIGSGFGALITSFKTPEQGAATQTWCATAPQLAGIGGVYCEDCESAELVAGDDPSTGGVREYAIDPDQAARLWTLSAELTRLDNMITTRDLERP